MKRNTQKHRHHVRLIVSVFAERHGQHLFITERRRSRITMSEPVGHVDANESIPQAALREFLEETGLRVALKSIIGIYYNHYAKGQISDSVRIAFFGAITKTPAQIVEQNIRLHWVKRADLPRIIKKLSHPTSRRALADFLRGQQFPLSVIRDLRL
ncbi:MAG: NUDIX domain-containing protein [Candidatus Kerfeldbacteria bacterium]|nr:NUDIX domain-containing protein [Candidatus Kerfeldbacteria bacterium]